MPFNAAVVSVLPDKAGSRSLPPDIQPVLRQLLLLNSRYPIALQNCFDHL